MPYLPITPQPKPEESIFSWTIRLAEGNFVPSPWHIFKLIGFSQGEMKTPRLDISRLWHLISDEPHILDSLKYADGPGYAFRGQPIGVRDLSVRSPKLCPDCIQENGFAHAHWDLELVTCCHVHGRQLIQNCPQCGKKITWFRANLLQCSCGSRFSEAPIEMAPNNEIALNELIYRVAFKKSSNAAASNPALAALSAVPLQYLLRFIASVGALSTQGRLARDKRNRIPVQDLMTVAAKVLDGWPDSFHEFLMGLTERPPRARQERFGVLGYINDFQAAMLERPGDREHGELFRSEIRIFLSSTWDGPIDSRIVEDLIRHGLTPKWISLPMASRQLGVDRRTLESIMNRGLIQYKVEETPNSRRTILRSEDIKSDWFASTDLLNNRIAATRLGIPVSVLRELRNTGEYVQTYFGANAVSFATRDVDALKKLVLSGKHYIQGDPDHGVALRDVMRMKFRSSAAKADVVRAIIRSDIRTVQAVLSNLGDLLLHPNDLKAVVEKITLPEGGSMTVRHAGVALHTTKETVQHLVEKGFLTSRNDGEIDANSVRTFIDCVFR